jgi:hypothetical protein
VSFSEPFMLPHFLPVVTDSALFAIVTSLDWMSPHRCSCTAGQVVIADGM